MNRMNCTPPIYGNNVFRPWQNASDLITHVIPSWRLSRDIISLSLPGPTIGDHTIFLTLLTLILMQRLQQGLPWHFLSPTLLLSRLTGSQTHGDTQNQPYKKHSLFSIPLPGSTAHQPATWSHPLRLNVISTPPVLRSAFAYLRTCTQYWEP